MDTPDYEPWVQDSARRGHCLDSFALEPGESSRPSVEYSVLEILTDLSSTRHLGRVKDPVDPLLFFLSHR